VCIHPPLRCLFCSKRGVGSPLRRIRSRDEATNVRTHLCSIRITSALLPSSLVSLVTCYRHPNAAPYSPTERQPHSRPMSSTSSPQTPIWYPAAATFVFNVASTGLFVACWRLWYEWREIRDMGKVSCWQLCCKLVGQIGHFVLCFLKFAISTAVLVDCFIPSHQKEVLRTLLSFGILCWVILSVCCLYPLKGYAYLS
jgi:hypothetical protein